MYRFAIRYIVVFTFLILRLMKELESILLIEMECPRMIVCIYHKKTATSLVVLIGKPVFENVQNLSANISASTLKLLVNSKTSDKHGRITASTFGIAYSSVQSVCGGTSKMSCFYAIVGYGEEPNNAMRLFFCYPTISFAQ